MHQPAKGRIRVSWGLTGSALIWRIPRFHERESLMAGMDGIRQSRTPFDAFLYAVLGEDHAGNAVSVLSALARLGLDPWVEAAGLSAMSKDGARKHLGLLLVRFHDVPALGRDPGAIIPQLVDLLPMTGQRQAPLGLGVPVDLGAVGPRPLLIALMIVLFLAQIVIFGFGATGD